jgi:hypothetical protein
MENNKKQLDLGINNSTLINIMGEGGRGERECESAEKFTQIKNVCLAKMRILYHCFMCGSTGDPREPDIFKINSTQLFFK